MRLSIVIFTACVACSGDTTRETSKGSDTSPEAVDALSGDTGPPVRDAASIDVADAEVGTEASLPFENSVRSLELTRSIAVRIEPRKQSERYGTIAARTRVAWKRVSTNDDCSKRWVEIEPYGWICEYYLRPSEKLPEGVELPRLERGELVPGVYGKVIAEVPMIYHRLFPRERREGVEEMFEARALEGSVNVRRYDQVVVDEVEYWRINDRGRREYVPRESLREHRPSTLHGMRLGDDTGRTLPVAFAMRPDRLTGKVPIYSAARRGRLVERISGRTPLAILDTVVDSKDRPVSYRVGENRWIRAVHVRLAQATPRPDRVGEREHWFDIDLDTQILVAYEGDLPVYTTLLTSGSNKYRTPTGMFRVWVKFSEKNMSDLAGEAPYSVATVPWAQFYDKDFALHTAYWHDKFGTRRSHGCINLAPRDARFLYFWSEPEVPPGWSMAKGTPRHPGSLVRIRDQDDPNPEYQGYALQVYEQRATTSIVGSPNYQSE